MNESMLLALGPVASGAFAMFGAVLLWPRTREPGWMLVILAVILYYGTAVFQALEVFGLARLATGSAWLDTVVKMAIGNGPFILLGIGLLVTYRDKVGPHP